MGTYDGPRALAARLIAKKGRLARLERLADGAPPDPGKPWRKGPSVSQAWGPFPAVFLEYTATSTDSPFAQYGMSVGKLSVPEASEQAYVAASALGERPAPSDRVLDGSRTLTVIQVEVLAPGDADVLYVLYVKE